MKLSLDALTILDAIDTRGSFAAAAQALHRVPSALTHAINKLEHDLAVTLFVREGRRAVLTPAGRVLLEEGRHLLRAAGELECRVKRVATGWESELRIAVDAVLDAAALFPLIDAFYAQLSGTRLRLTAEVLGGCWDALFTGRADLALGAPGDAPPGGGCRTLLLGAPPFVFAVAPGHPLAQAKEPLAAAQVQQHRAVVVADTSRQLLARTVGLISGQDMLVVPDLAAKLAAQVAGLGVGHLPLRLAAAEIAAGRLLAKRLAAPQADTPVYAAWRGDQEGKALKWFVERLEDAGLRASLLGEAAPRRATRAATRSSR